jgi:hypothetical protein
MTLFETLKKELKPQQVKMGKCIYCGETTEETQVIADDVDEEGQATGCREWCCPNCYENMKDKQDI